ncbi:MAG: hypothetical protein KAU06_04790 [Candidatus Marinimicrobia bacterium]|nr:hypothetical protein [Candidatus Neomarinimicrobiota bacterium]
MKEALKKAILKELNDNPKSAVEMLNLVTTQINNSIEIAKKELDTKARTALWMGISVLGAKTIRFAKRHRKAVLEKMFLAYGEPDEGECEAVKRAWEFLNEDES